MARRKDTNPAQAPLDLAARMRDLSDQSPDPGLPADSGAVPAAYRAWLAALKVRIEAARRRAAQAVSRELVQLYWQIGRDILERQQAQGRGAKVIDRLARDLKDAFPNMRGWSSSNLKYIRYFAQHCPEGRFGQQPADQLPWFHVVTLPPG